MLDDFRAPAVGADDGGILGLGLQRVRQIRRGIDQRMRADIHRGRPNDDGGGIHKSHGQLAGVGCGQFKLVRPNIALGQSGHQVIHHQLRAAVHRNVRNHNAVAHAVGGPILVGVQNQLGVVMNGAVAGRD